MVHKGGHRPGMPFVGMDQFSVLCQFPHENRAFERTRDKILVNVTYDQICDVVFITGQPFVLVNQSAGVNIVKMGFDLVPRVNNTFFFIYFHAF